MFLTGMKFALGFIAGLCTFSEIYFLAIVGAAAFSNWQQRRRHRLWRERGGRSQHPAPKFRERAVFCFRFRTDDWITAGKKTEYLERRLPRN